MTDWAAGMDMTTARLLASALGDVKSYSPVVAGGGSLAFSTQDGWYFKLGPLVYVNIYLVASAAASGVANITITTPTNPDRSHRQVLRGFATSWGGGNHDRDVALVAFTGGSGAVWDALYTSQNTATDYVRVMSDTGATWPAGAVTVISGWYLSA